MDDKVRRTMDSIAVGDELASITIPITLQRLVMEAGANRDFSLIHHDGEIARATGAKDAYMNTFFIAGMFERLLREWMGVHGQINKVQNLRMKAFNVVGDVAQFKGQVTELLESQNQAVIDLSCETDGGETVTATATVTLPTKK